jgi:uncharacterized protein YcfL
MKIKIKNIILIFFLLQACSSIELPTIEESQNSIISATQKLSSIENYIKAKTSQLTINNDLELLVRTTVLNRILSALANERTDDLKITFLPTKPFIKEDKKILGIEYSNYINIESGQVNMNLKSLNFKDMKRNKIKANIEIKGDGNINVSGKHTGIPAFLTTDVDLYLNEDIQFELRHTNKQNLILIPIPKKLKLETKFTISLSKWFIPWHEEIELELSDILSPIQLPMNLNANIELPIPSRQKAGEFEYTEHQIDFSNVSINTENDIIIWKSNLDLLRIK